MTWHKPLGIVILVMSVAAGSWLAPRPARARPGLPLVADLHVHPFPGDGALTIRELQHEAARRGLDVIAVTGHDNQAAWRFANATTGLEDNGVIVLPGQEVTNPRFHIVAVGIPRPVESNREARAVIEEIHSLGGAAIAAHPTDDSWVPRDPATLSLLDGVEVAHPAREQGKGIGGEIDRFFAETRRVNPRVSAIGSSDFHRAAPLGRCRTYIFVDERSAADVVRALRAGQTVAEDVGGRLSGPAELIARVTPELRARSRDGAATAVDKACALAALLGLALLSAPPRLPVQLQPRRRER